MYKGVILCCVLLLFSAIVSSQVFPTEGSVLNYRIIGFQLPANSTQGLHSIEIAIGAQTNPDSFRKHIVASKLGFAGDRAILRVPKFGTSYTWLIKTKGDKSQPLLRHFNVGKNPFTDTTKFRLNITHSSELNEGIYTFLDANRTLYDDMGQPVWYLPAIDSPVNTETNSRDLKLSPFNTLTLVLGSKAYEIDYNGGVLWQAPEAAHVPFHHEFVRLANGHYMVLATEFFEWKFPNINEIKPEGNTTPSRTTGSNSNGSLPMNRKLPFGIVAEYDRDGKEVWSWHSFSYFVGSDIRYRRLPTAMILSDVHDNAFFFDEKNKSLYVSFKNISRVVKVDYPSGRVAQFYGQYYKEDGSLAGDNNFCFQHSCKISEDGLLYLFNNGCDVRTIPSVDFFEFGENNTLKKVWTKECLPENNFVTELKSPGKFFETSGGNVIELNGGKVFVSYCSPYSKVMILDKNKHELWAGIPELWNEQAKRWDAHFQYRASVITQSELEKLIWGGLLKK